MSIDKLHADLNEYTMRIEEVLSGMDRALTDLANRVAALERRAATDPGEAERIDALDEQVAALGLAVTQLLGNDHA